MKKEHYIVGAGLLGAGVLIWIASRQPGKSPNLFATSSKSVPGETPSSARSLLLVPNPDFFPDYNAFAGHVSSAQGIMGVSAIRVRSGPEMIEVIRRNAPISKLVLVGHGTATQFMRPSSWGVRIGGDTSTWVSASTLGRALQGALAPNAVVSFAGCRAAADPGEADWGRTMYTVGGSNSLVARVRDVANRADVEWRGKVATGSAATNPTGRSFSGTPGSSGRPIGNSASSHSRESIMRWTFGGSLLDLSASFSLFPVELE